MAGAEKSAVEAQTRDRTGTVQGPQRGQRAQSRGRRLGRPDDKAGPCHRGAKWWAVVRAGLTLLWKVESLHKESWAWGLLT